MWAWRATVNRWLSNDNSSRMVPEANLGGLAILLNPKDCLHAESLRSLYFDTNSGVISVRKLVLKYSLSLAARYRSAFWV